VSAAIAANRSSAKSVILVGHGEVKGYATTKVAKPEKPPYHRQFKFTFTADDFGRRKRWEDSWTGDPAASEQDSRFALVDDKVLSVLNRGAGLIEPAEFMHSNPPPICSLDFYRDHWPSVTDDESVEAVLKHSFNQKRLQWTVQELPDGTISMTCHDVEDKDVVKPLVIEVQPSRGYLVSKLIDFAELPAVTYQWKQDAGTQIWYVAKKTFKTWVKLPSGLVYWDEAVIEIDEAHFNESVPEEKFTFGGLGLKPGSAVYDARVSPNVRYVYQPGAQSLDAVAEGVVPPAAAEAWEREQVSRHRWIVRARFTGFVLVAGVGGGYLYARSRRRAKPAV